MLYRVMDEHMLGKAGKSTAGGQATKEKRQRKPRKQNEKEILKDFFIQELPPHRELVSHVPKTHPFTKPKNARQEELVQHLKNKEKKIILITGPAGTGKTLFSTEHGIQNFLSGVYEKLIFTRPSVSVDEELGFLPGTLEDKMAPWIRPIYDVLYNFISVKEVQSLMEEKIIEIVPLGFMRGRTFKNTWIVADEMQNCSVSQMKMLLTRLGENSRLIITGDLEQYDRPNQINGLEDFLNKFRNHSSKNIVCFGFERSDIQREEVVKEVLDIYEL